MPTKAVESAINDQIAMELESAYVYLAMAAYFEENNLAGFSHWMRMQHQEEMVHAMKLFDFVLNSGGHIVLKALAKPPGQFTSALQVMKQSLKHEQKVTSAITTLYELAVKEKDYPAQILLQWFIAEQAEEEKTVGDIIAQMELVGDSGPGLMLIDQRLAARTAEQE